MSAAVREVDTGLNLIKAGIAIVDTHFTRLDEAEKDLVQKALDGIDAASIERLRAALHAMQEADNA